MLRPLPLTAFAKSLARALEGFNLYTVHKLSRKVKKIMTEPGFGPGSGG